MTFGRLKVNHAACVMLCGPDFVNLQSATENNLLQNEL